MAKISLIGVGVLSVVTPVQLILSGPISQKPPFEVTTVTLTMQTGLAVAAFMLLYLQAGSITFGSAMGQLTVLAHRPATLFRANMTGAVQAAAIVMVLMTPMTVFVVAYVGIELATFARLALCVVAGGLFAAAAIVLSDVCWGKGPRLVLTCWAGGFVALVGLVCLSGFAPAAELMSTITSWFVGQIMLQWVVAVGAFALACLSMRRTLRFADAHFLDWRDGALDAAEDLRERRQRPPVLFHRSGTRPSRSLRTRYPFAEAAWLGRIDAAYSRWVLGGFLVAITASATMLSLADPRLVFEGTGTESPLLIITGGSALVTAESLAVLTLFCCIYTPLWLSAEAANDRLELLALTRPVRTIIWELLTYTLIATTALAAAAALAYWSIAVQLTDPLDPRWGLPGLLLGVPAFATMISLITLGVSLRWSASSSGARFLIAVGLLVIGPLSVWLMPRWIKHGLSRIEAEPAVFANARREAAVREQLGA